MKVLYHIIKSKSSTMMPVLLDIVRTVQGYLF